MSKDDVPPLPDRPPHKRKQMEQALDIHLAMWANLDTLTPSDKRRVQEERDRRKQAKKETERVGLVFGNAGVTPEQYETLKAMLTGRRGEMSAIWHPWVRSPVHSLCKSFGVPVESYKDKDQKAAWKAVVRNSTVVIVLPSGLFSAEWDMVTYARHRNIPVEVVTPDGERR